MVPDPIRETVMPRPRRVFEPGYCYHLLNRSNDRGTLFHSADDYRTFIRVMHEACEKIPLRILAYCIMPNHFHLVVWPDERSDVSGWMRWWMSVHAAKYQKAYDVEGHLWKGRFKSFPIQEDEHLLTVIRYIERNPLRAGLVSLAADWHWSSLRWRNHPNRPVFLTNGPVPLPPQPRWIEFVNEPQTEAELAAIRKCVHKGRPYGSESWIKQTAHALGLASTLKDPGRPRARGQAPFR